MADKKISALTAAAAAADVAVGSYFKCHCVGAANVQTCGQWS